MSFYNVQNSTKFVIENDDSYAVQKLDFLQAGFNQPPVNTSLNVATSATAFTFSASQVVNAGYIARNSAGSTITDVLPSAAAIIAALNNNQAIRQLSTANVPVVVGPGFSGNLIINNTSANAITLSGGTGITISISITAGVNLLKYVVTNTTAGSEAITFLKL
jgi:hypothetical protein